MNIPHNVPAPSLLWLVAEPRAAIEALSVIFTKQTWQHVPKGNGEPVMVLPGLGTNDFSTTPLRKFLSNIGYDVYGWELGINRGFKPEYEDKMLKRLRQIYIEKKQPVKLVGWSMGGIYARELAKIDNHVISQVITMGSPFSGGKTQKTNANLMYRILNGAKINATHDARAFELPLPPSVPTTAIYSKTDGVVAWKYCIEYANEEHLENIEVKGSHLGFGANSLVWMILADRLSQDPQNWKPFDEKHLKKVNCKVLI